MMFRSLGYSGLSFYGEPLKATANTNSINLLNCKLKTTEPNQLNFLLRPALPVLLTLTDKNTPWVCYPRFLTKNQMNT